MSQTDLGSSAVQRWIHGWAKARSASESLKGRGSGERAWSVVEEGWGGRAVAVAGRGRVCRGNGGNEARKS